MVFCWLSLATLIIVRGDRILPSRLARWIDDLICKAEKASAYLLIVSFYNGQFKTCASPAFEKAAMNLVAIHGTITLNTLTITGIIKRLKTLQSLLHNLAVVARRLGKSVAAHARVLAMKIEVMQIAYNQSVTLSDKHSVIEDAIPP